jgi:CRISPR-associated protein Cmr6
MPLGRVQRWNGRDGLLTDEQDRARFFFHINDLIGLSGPEVHVGLDVEYDRDRDDRGPHARNVRRRGAPAAPRPATAVAQPVPPKQGPPAPPAKPPGRPPVALPPLPLDKMPLPASTAALIRSVPLAQRHPGLQLDRYGLPCPQQEQQRDVLNEVVVIPGPGPLLKELLDRRHAGLDALNATKWTRTTDAPLTLHLARASALENAGLCLHRVYGFAYLPGSGLKGMARAYAERVWLEEESDKAAAWAQIEMVFGWAPGSDLIAPKQPKSWRPPDAPPHGKDDAAAAGAVVFHDAWPAAWPRLHVDIVNNHHAQYYQDTRHQTPPGDWDSPVPVYFLVVSPGTTFSFALSKRRPEAAGDADLLTLARRWLDGALTHLGCGAKTAAGYGGFTAPRDAPKFSSSRWTDFTATLELVTPAFLAGADHSNSTGCDLRPATLRGLLRWWWRTLHAGYLTAEELATFEAAVWGDTVAGGAARVQFAATRAVGPTLFNFKDRFEPRADFKRAHGLADRPDNKTTQGLFYLAYGMDEVSRGQPKRRFFLDAGSAWEARVLARPSLWFRDRETATRPERRSEGVPLTATDVAAQVEAALWLLGRFGGVGSKARKGFGSLRVTFGPGAGHDERHVLAAAAALRDRLYPERVLDPRLLGSPSLDDPLCVVVELALPWADPWQALDRVGFAYQAVAQQHKHDGTKAALGLPRKIHGPRDDGPMQTRDGRYLQDPATWRPPEWLDFPRRPRDTRPENARHASPVHLHLDRDERGQLAVRLVAFPAADLPNREASAGFLSRFCDRFRAELEQRAQAESQPAPGPVRPIQARPAPAGPARSGPPTSSQRRPPGTPVRVMVKERHEKGGPAAFRVQEPGKEVGILSSSTPPTPLPQVGDEIDVFINSDDPRSPQYRWTPSEQPQQRPRPRPGGGRR